MSGLGQFVVIVYSTIGLSITAVAVFLLRRTTWKWPVAAVFISVVAMLAILPFLEERHIRSKYEELCNSAGVHVVRPVAVEGYVDERSKVSGLKPGVISHRSAVAEYDRRGYRFYERPTYTRSKISHIEKIQGQWTEVLLEKPMSRYAVRHVAVDGNYRLSAGHRIWKEETVVVDLLSNEVVGRALLFKRVANTIEGSILGLFGSTLELCYGPLKEREDWRPHRLVELTLIPLHAPAD